MAFRSSQDRSRAGPVGLIGHSYGGAVITAAASDDEGFLTLDRDMFPEVFASDVPIEQAKVLAAVQKPTHGSCFATPLPVKPGWQTLPCAYIASAKDQMINPEGQQWMAERIGAAVTTLDSSHASPVSHGPEVAAAILAALGS